MTPLEHELLDMVVEVCDIPAPVPAMASDAPLIGPASPLGLDSLDAVEIIVTIQMRYGIRIDAEKIGRTILQTLGSLATFVDQNKKEDSGPSNR